MTTIAVRRPRGYAYSASTGPRPGVIPIVKASLPFAPKRCFPIWSVVTHGRTVRIPLLMNLNGRCRDSTSQVTRAIFAPGLDELGRALLLVLDLVVAHLERELGPAAVIFFASISRPPSRRVDRFILLVRSTAAPSRSGPLSARPRRSRHRHRSDEAATARTSAPPRPQVRRTFMLSSSFEIPGHYNTLLSARRADRPTASNASLPLRASSSAGSFHNESAKSFPNVPSSEKTSRS